MRQNQKGITLIGLLITIIVIVIIAGVSIYTGRDLLNEAKTTELETNILLIQAAGKTLYNKHTLDDSVELVGTKITEENIDDFYLDSENYYILDKTDLEKLGVNLQADELDETNLNSELETKKNVYVINYKENTAFYLNSDFYKNYQPVEYIQTTGKQYIDTGVKGNTANYKLLLDVEITNNPTANNSYFLGMYNGAKYYGLFGIYKDGRYRLLVGNKGDCYSDIKYTLNARTNLEVNAKANEGTYTASLKINNTIKNFTYSNYENIDLTLYLFNVNYNNNVTNEYMSCKLYNCVIEQDDVLVRDFVPCYRKADNVAGLYDMVNNKFYTNQGTESFSVGNKITYVK